MPTAGHFQDPTETITGGHSTLRLYHADAIELLATLPEGLVDVIVTSPPYNLGIAYSSYDDALPGDQYLAWTRDWLGAARRVLAPDGSLFLNVGAKPTEPWTAFDIVAQARERLTLQNTIHWIKSIVIDRDLVGAGSGLERDLAVGHYKPVNSPRFLNDCHEFVFHLTPSGRTPLERRAIGVRYQDESNIDRWKAASEGLRCRGNTWFIPYETIQNRDRDRPHPATFPVLLAERCLRLHGVQRGAVVLDPFMGLGNTAIACSELDVDFVGVDVDADYVTEAATRIRSVIAEASGRLPY